MNEQASIYPREEDTSREPTLTPLTKGYTSSESFLIITDSDRDQTHIARYSDDALFRRPLDTSTIILEEVKNLKKKVAGLEEAVEVLRSDMDSHLGVTRSYYKDLSQAEIKEIIKDHIEEEGNFWPDELAEEYNLSVLAVMEAIDELVEEGVLERKNKNDVPRRTTRGN